MNNLSKINFKRYFVIGLALLFFFNFFNFSAVSESEGKPDLEISYVDFPDDVTEDEEVEFVIKVKNKVNDETGEYGNISAGTKIWISLKVDHVRVAVDYYSSGLNVGDSVYINLSWTAELGAQSERQILIEVNYKKDIPESNGSENNNERPGVINVQEKDAELSITNVLTPDILVVNNSYTVSASVKNSGSATSESIRVFFNSSVEGLVETLVFENILERDEVHVFYFNWTPSKLGRHIINVDVIYSGKTHDSYSSSVFVGSLDWFNESWHYRYFISVRGFGNFSKTFNFTSMLEDLNVVNESFENDTIRIVQYSSEGEIINESISYNFNESVGYDAINNSNGTLLWNVSDSDEDKYYCIYFDVSSNDGARYNLPENTYMNESGNATVKYDGFVEGWNFEINNPSGDSYVLSGDLVYISVTTESMADHVKVFVFLNENESNNKTVYLESIDGIIWENSTVLNEQGNWTFKIKCWDAAGFITLEKEQTLFVGKPDLIFSDILLETSWAPTSPLVYINDTVYLTASIFCSFATVDDANVTMRVFNNESVEIYSESINSTFEKDKYNNISFEWNATQGGNFTFNFSVDSDDIIDETNESNNELQENITVYYWPDLVVTSISWKKSIIMEYEDVKFTVKVKNIGRGDAKDYDLKLFIKPSSQKTIQYEDEVYTKKISVDSGDKKEFYLYWESAQAGNWYVAAKAFVSDTKQDSNTSNNGLFIKDELIIRPAEKNKPIIKNVYTSPATQQQGGTIDIIADVTDDTGLGSVFVSIYDSSETLIESGDMIRIADDGFKYIFSKTTEIDTYTFIITAIDISINKNNATYEGLFDIIKDNTNPVVSHIWAEPMIQLLGDTTTVSCIAQDNVGVDYVELVLTYPNGSIKQLKMEDKSNRYIYEDIYKLSGKYSYYIIVKDKANNIKTSKTQYFYITRNLNDIDDDEMPDWWEERYGFDPLDSTDGSKDYDEDGLTNSEEYLGNTHPHKDILIQNIAYRVRSNVLYIALSISMFALLLILSYIIRRR